MDGEVDTGGAIGMAQGEDRRPEDRDEIGELVLGYAYAVDERDWARFESLFVPDAELDYREAGGIQGDPAAVAAWLPDALALFDWTMHSISTHRILFDGPDSATGQVHVVARHGVRTDGDEECMEVAGIYRDRYVRTAEGWRLAARREDVRWIGGGPFADAVRRSAREQ